MDTNYWIAFIAKLLILLQLKEYCIVIDQFKTGLES